MGDGVRGCKKCGVFLHHPNERFACTLEENRYEAKRDQGKPRPSLIPWGGIWAVVEVAESGISKGYVPHSWKDVPDAAARYREALLRHALEYAADPESTDGESGLLHLQHLAWNSLALLALRAVK